MGLFQGFSTKNNTGWGGFCSEIRRKTRAASSPRHQHSPIHLGHTRGRPPARCEAAGVALERPDENELFCIRSWAVSWSEYNKKRELHTRHCTPTRPHTSGTPGAGHPRAVRPPRTRWRAQTGRSSLVSEIWSFVSEIECVGRVPKVGS